MLDIQVEEADGYTICRPVGELDAYTVGRFRESLGEVASRPKLLIDMSAVPFVDSAGLGALIGGIRRARESGNDVAVCMDLRLEESAGRLPKLPVLILLDRRPDVFLAKRAGADGWVVKPLDPLRVRKAVNELLAGRHYFDEARKPLTIPPPAR